MKILFYAKPGKRGKDTFLGCNIQILKIQCEHDADIIALDLLGKSNQLPDLLDRAMELENLASNVNHSDGVIAVFKTYLKIKKEKDSRDYFLENHGIDVKYRCSDDFDIELKKELK